MTNSRTGLVVVVVFVTGLICGALLTSLWVTKETGEQTNEVMITASPGWDFGTETRAWYLHELWQHRSEFAGQHYENIYLGVPGRGQLIFSHRDDGIIILYEQTPGVRF